MAISMKKVLLVVFVAVVVYYLLGIFQDGSIGEDALKGKNIIITGASSGIGEQTAYWYSRHGANVFITARREPLLKQVVSKCAELGGPTVKAGYSVTDLALEGDRERLIQEAHEFFGEVDQLILNHVKVSAVQIWTGSKDQVDQLQQIINVNLMGYVHLTALTLPSLTKARGSVGVVGSFLATDSSLDSMKILSPLSKHPDLLHKFVDFAPSAEDVADKIGSATTLRQAQLYYPSSQLLWPQVIARAIWAQCPEYLMMF